MKWEEALAILGVELLFLGVRILTWKLVHDHPQWIPISFSWPHEPPQYWVKAATDIPDCAVYIVQPSLGDVTANNSFPVKITVRAVGSSGCHADGATQGPGFDVKPESQKFDLPDKQGNQSMDFTFLLLPREVGKQAISLTSPTGKHVLYYTIKPSEFLPAWMTPIIGPLLSALGPMLTLPWWIERRKKKREEAAKKKAVEEARKNEKPAIVIP